MSKLKLMLQNFKLLNRSSRLIFFFFVSFLTSTLLLFYSSTLISAQVPDYYWPCKGKYIDPLSGYVMANPEFQSTRPYQSSPCKRWAYNTAKSCGNDLVVSDKIEVTQGDAPKGAKNCLITRSGGKTIYKCSFEVEIEKDFEINLSGADFPILGNSELVANSTIAKDQISDAQKVNEYVNWYLTGVNYKPEYGELDMENMEDVDKLVNYSGPVNKLLPWEIQAGIRIDSMNESAEHERHNQIVVCTNLAGKIKPCYKGDGARAPKPRYRIESWFKKNDLASALNTTRQAVINLYKLIFPDTDTTLIEDSLASIWEKKTPPLTWDPEFKDEYERNPLLYKKHYNEWRGKACLIIPNPFGGEDFLLCYDSPLVKNKWSELFPYIPLSSNEDRLGELDVTSASVTSPDPDVEILEVFVESDDANLYFAHTEEVEQLASHLQDTYLPDGMSGKAATSNVEAVKDEGQCKFIEVRSNPGDNLFAGAIRGYTEYKAKFTCKFKDGDKKNQKCTKDVAVGLKVRTKTPLANQIWKRTVGGDTSVFKRIFPKVGEGGAITGILDIPAATNVVYTGGGAPSGDNELYFPHFGGVQEYFLKGIQTILRPKGYGEQIISGQATGSMCTPGGEGGEVPKLTAASSACKLKITTSGYRDIDLTPTLIKILNAAAEEYQIPAPLLLSVMFGEGAFDRAWEWTEANVKDWARECVIYPDCDPDDSTSQGMFQIFQREWDEHGDGVLVLDPKRTPQRCNLLDEVFAVARKLSKEASGWGGYPPPQSCFGIKFNTGSGGPQTCSTWDHNDIATAYRQWAGACVSVPGTGILGISGGTCPLDNCEQYEDCFVKGESCSSHSYYSWDVYTYFAGKY